MTTPADPEVYSNPVRLSVATRESNSDSNAVAGPSTKTNPLNERERLFEARKANEIIRRKGEKWADKLMEETVDRETFKRALRYITSQTYLEITSERHLNNLCSYPLCSKPPLAPYNPQKRFRISTLNRSITEVEGNKEEGYCTRSCRVKSEWVRTKLEEGGSVLGRGKGWTVELVEDLGLDLEAVSGMVEGNKAPPMASDGKKAGRVSVSSNGGGSTISTMDKIRQCSSSNGQRRQSTAPRIPSSTASLPPSLIPPSADTPVDMLANLHIHERPTPATSAPSPSPLRPNTDPQPSTSSSTISNVTSPSRSKRAPTSIIGEQSKLAQTVLKASKAINPIPQVNPDSEDEGEHEEVEWEREVGLEWGEVGDDLGVGDDLWEAMRTAREIGDE